MRTFLFFGCQLSQYNLFSNKIYFLIIWCVFKFDKKGCSKLATTYASDFFKLLVVINKIFHVNKLQELLKINRK